MIKACYLEKIIFCCRKLEENKPEFLPLYNKWRISLTSAASTTQSENNEIKTYVIVFIVVGIVLALLIIFALCMVMRTKRQ